MIIRLLAALSAVHQSITDSFFAGRFAKKMENLISAYLENKKKAEETGYVAQYRLLKTIESLIESIEELKHLKLSRELPLSLAHDRLLRYNLDCLKNKISQPAMEEKALSKSAERKSMPSAPLSGNAEKIFSFVKSASRARAKDIIDEFSVLSERTVKRSLRELIRTGALKKFSEDRVRYYSVSGR